MYKGARCTHFGLSVGGQQRVKRQNVKSLTGNVRTLRICTFISLLISYLYTRKCHTMCMQHRCTCHTYTGQESTGFT